MDVCIATLNCYDLLQRCIDSIMAGTLLPERILVVDNGGNLSKEIYSDNPRVQISSPGENIGVAATWNWFITHTKDARIISNDDIVFAPDTVARMQEAIDKGALFVHGNDTIGGFSLFALSDAAVKLVGVFDEGISPKYAYYEDNDYAYRLRLAGIKREDVETQIFHTGSATLRRYTPAEEAEHWRKFSLAKMNYILKWGGEPSHETRDAVYERDLPT
jgi:GT2 family glycosyltransferase